MDEWHTLTKFWGVTALIWGRNNVLADYISSYRNIRGSSNLSKIGELKMISYISTELPNYWAFSSHAVGSVRLKYSEEFPEALITRVDPDDTRPLSEVGVDERIFGYSPRYDDDDHTYDTSGRHDYTLEEVLTHALKECGYGFVLKDGRGNFEIFALPTIEVVGVDGEPLFELGYDVFESYDNLGTTICLYDDLDVAMPGITTIPLHTFWKKFIKAFSMYVKESKRDEHFLEEDAYREDLFKIAQVLQESYGNAS